jgi:acyl CoA:acetate/3-ketoacid CoA transferase beta subunit
MDTVVTTLVDRIATDLCVFDLTAGGPVLTERALGVSVEHVRTPTADFRVDVAGADSLGVTT